MRCSAITKGGTRCRLDASYGSYCYQHAPDTEQERRRNARRGGLKGGNGRPAEASGLSEITEAKSWIRGLVVNLLKGEVERDIATACFMGLNIYLRAISVELKAREQLELTEKVESLEQAMREANKSGGGSRWRGA